MILLLLLCKIASAKLMCNIIKNFEVLSTSKKDKGMSWILAFVISAVTGFWIYVISFWAIYSIINFMEFLYNKIKLCKAYFKK